MEEIAGVLERVIFKSPETGFSVFNVKVSGQSIIAKGVLQNLHQGQSVVMQGVWEFHQKFGRQFSVTNCSAELPTHADGIQKYLSSGLIKGIGPKFAERLVARFGINTLEIIDKEPEKLTQVEGVGPQRAMAICAAWKDQKEISRVMVFLQSKDVSTGFAVKIFKTYGQQSIEKITENPYRLVEDIWGVGFKTADGLALKLGIEKESLYRIKSGILHSISELLNNGHLYGTVTQVKEEAGKLLELPEESNDLLLKQALHELYREEKIKLVSYEDEHFITLPQYYYVEKGIAKKILQLNEYPPLNRFDFDQIYKQVCEQDARGVLLNEQQQRGAISALQQKVSIITGGPGTGKTTLIKKLLDLLDANKIKVKLAAPTGRAAKRMFEGTGRYAETLHRLLEFSPMPGGFTRNEQNALDAEFIIVDEASMIDAFLMYALLRAIPSKAHLLFLGDVDQLPSVGAGNILNDLIASQKVCVTRLTEIFRQAQDSLIIVNAHNINQGKFPVSFIEGSKRDFVFVPQKNPEELFSFLAEVYTKKLAHYHIKPEDAVVLVPMNRGIAGTARLNQELQKILNPREDTEHQIMRFGQVYKVGDRVMQIKNNYDKFVFNGDLGIIEAIDIPEQVMKIQFGERVLEYDFAELNELVLSYAISIHKSQGSEFSAVIIPIFMQHFVLLARNLLYTAVTRAKKLCILVGEPRAIAMAIKNNKNSERQTFLKQYLTSDLEAR